jgi:hypothetical protein
MLVTMPLPALCSADITWLQSRRTISSTLSTAKAWVVRANSVTSMMFRPVFRLDAGDGRQVQHLDDLAAQVDHAQHVRGRAGDRGDLRHRDDLADLEDVNAEQLAMIAVVVAAEAEKQKLEFVGAREVAALVDFLLNRFHVPSQKVNAWERILEGNMVAVV